MSSDMPREPILYELHISLHSQIQMVIYKMLEENVKVKKHVVVIPSKIRRKIGLKEGEMLRVWLEEDYIVICLLYTSPSPRDRTRSRMPSSA